MLKLSIFRLTEESGSSDAPSQETTKRARDEQDVTSTCMELFLQHEKIAARFRNASDKHGRRAQDYGPGARLHRPAELLLLLALAAQSLVFEYLSLSAPVMPINCVMLVLLFATLQLLVITCRK